MKGYKGYIVFNSDWTDRYGHQYEIGKTYESELKPGFNVCEQLLDCFNYHLFTPKLRIAEVIAERKIDSGYAKITLLREIPWEEVLKLCNTGHFNLGHGNSGDFNTGDHNPGTWNTGTWNWGNYNTGRGNTGHNNTGHFNSGDHNSGNENTGQFNSGNKNRGSWNTGTWNLGNHCTGDFNLCDFSVGCFCTEEPKIKFFDKESDMTLREWYASEAYSILMYKDWDSLDEDDLEILRGIPNFDADKFYLITGIKV